MVLTPSPDSVTFIRLRRLKLKAAPDKETVNGRPSMPFAIQQLRRDRVRQKHGARIREAFGVVRLKVFKFGVQLAWPLGSNDWWNQGSIYTIPIRVRTVTRCG